MIIVKNLLCMYFKKNIVLMFNLIVTQAKAEPEGMCKCYFIKQIRSRNETCLLTVKLARVGTGGLAGIGPT